MLLFNIEAVKELLKAAWFAVIAFIATLAAPIHNFVIVILILGSLNIFFGLAADKFKFNFKKAFKSLLYLAGYLFVIFMAVIVTELMRIKETDIKEVISWITWVMVWFYAANILKNWNYWQPDNKVISFLYWVVSFKVIEKITWLKEFHEKDNKKEDNGNAIE